jgi:speckle-type POZ protein
MPRHRCTVYSESDYDDDDDDNVTMRCLSCEEDYDPDDAGTCKECYDEANASEEELKRQIQDLKSKVSFLALSSPLDAPSTTDLVLLPSTDAFSPSIPAHKAVLVSTHSLPLFIYLFIYLFLMPCILRLFINENSK